MQVRKFDLVTLNQDFGHERVHENTKEMTLSCTKSTNQ